MDTKQFCEAHRIRMTAEPADCNPNMPDDAWAAIASHYRCTLRRPGHTLTTYYSMGSAHTKPPTVDRVVSCLTLEAAGIANGETFEEWARELGYDTNSHKAKKQYLTVQRQTARLARFLGRDLLGALLYHTDPE